MNSTHTELGYALENLWHQDFPLSNAMQMQVAQFDGIELNTRTPLEPNTNIHGTAFAGSLYAIQALTAWGLLYLQLKLAGIDASIIHASGQIEFTKPVTGDIFARSSFAGHNNSLNNMASTGKVKLELVTEVVANDQVASRFSGIYLARLN